MTSPTLHLSTPFTPAPTSTSTSGVPVWRRLLSALHLTRDPHQPPTPQVMFDYPDAAPIHGPHPTT